jgi:hypothetical protein
VVEKVLEVHLSDSTIHEIVFAVEPRQLALNVCVVVVVCISIRVLLIVCCRFVG